MATRVLVADGPDGALFAAVEPTAHHVQAAVARARFPAVLNPFRAEEAAKAALMMAGGENVREHLR